jgi:hypothetical protein
VGVGWDSSDCIGVDVVVWMLLLMIEEDFGRPYSLQIYIRSPSCPCRAWLPGEAGLPKPSRSETLEVEA